MLHDPNPLATVDVAVAQVDRREEHVQWPTGLRTTVGQMRGVSYPTLNHPAAKIVSTRSRGSLPNLGVVVVGQ